MWRIKMKESDQNSSLCSQKVSTLAIISLVLSLWPFGFIGGIICGHIARWRIKRKSELTGDSFARWGLGFSYFMLFLALGIFCVIHNGESILKEWTTDGMSIPYNVVDLGGIYAIKGKGLEIGVVKAMELIVNQKSYGTVNEGDSIKVYSKNDKLKGVFVNGRRVYRGKCILIKRQKSGTAPPIKGNK